MPAAGHGAATHHPSSEADPILAQYSVYWNQPRSRRIMILQFPNRDRTSPYNAAAGLQPLALRIKPRAGLVEIDIPLTRRDPSTQSLDRRKARAYGQALAEAETRTRGAPLGMAGGFGMYSAVRPAPVPAPLPPTTTSTTAPATTSDPAIAHSASNGAPAAKSASKKGLSELDGAMDVDEEENSDASDSDDSSHGPGLDRMTLGGRIKMPRDGDPVYAIGVFRGHPVVWALGVNWRDNSSVEELHLTRVDAFCALQPQLHHLDAITDNERAKTRALRALDATGPEPEARAVNMAVKSTDEDEQLDMGEVSRTLRTIQEEQWQTLEWVDEDDDRAYTIYHNELVATDHDKQTRLVSALSPQQYLEAISAPRIDPTTLGKTVMGNTRRAPGHSDVESSDDDDDIKVEVIEEDVGRPAPMKRKRPAGKESGTSSKG